MGPDTLSLGWLIRTNNAVGYIGAYGIKVSSRTAPQIEELNQARKDCRRHTPRRLKIAGQSKETGVRSQL